MKALSDKLLAAFDAEHREILACIRSHLSKFEQDRKEMTEPSLNEVFRMAHTLKGAARVVDLDEVVSLAHRLEELFAQVRGGKVPLDGDTLRSIRGSLDAIEDLVAASASATKKGAENAAAPAPAPVLDVPAVPKIAESETLRVHAGHLDNLLRMTGELLAFVQDDERLSDGLDAIEKRSASLSREWEALQGSVIKPLRRLLDAAELRKIAVSMEAVEKDIRQLSKQVRRARGESRQSSWRQNLFGEQLRQELKKVRMVAAEEVFDGLHKMVRTLASESGKQVELRAFGLEVEADRRVLQELRNPLMHMLRNCVSHGLEAAAERSSRGKPEMGLVTLRLEPVGGFLKVSLEDDGRGLDLKRIGETAVQNGLITRDDLSKKSEDEIGRFILEPGFSTASEVTDVSGRGMGLSVAHEAVKKLQGSLSVSSGAGRGTLFSITVPLSISSHRLLLVSAGEQGFSIPLHGVDRLMRITASDLKTIDGVDSLVLDEKPVRLQSLSHLLGLGSSFAMPSATDRIPVVVLKSGQARLAVVVDAIIGETEALIQDLGKPFAKCAHLLGAVILGDGTVSIVIEPGELLIGGLEKNLSAAVAAVSAAPAKAAQGLARILVVDDSFTTRTLEKNILEAHGYEVALAVDGAEALAKLRLAPFDLVISDVEMPLMDGFTLLAELKRNPRLAKMPVIMVTSREDAKDRERGLSLGADAYIIKQRFDQAILLEAISRFL